MSDVMTWIADGGRKPRVVVLASVNRPRVRADLGRITRILSASADIVAVDEDQSYEFGESPVDLVVVLGGDGSILSAARRMGLHQRPVIGVNLGKLGFLAALKEHQLEEIWPDICAGHCEIDSHVMLKCSVWRNGKQVQLQNGADHVLALNEAAILGGPPYSMLQIDLYVDRELASTYSCDGLLISTPVGSTAHNLSAGGPILNRRLDAVVISPISPHTLTMRPVVDDANRIFEMCVMQGHESVSALADGRVLFNLQEGDCFCLEKAPVAFQMIAIPGKSEYLALREKLGWGGNPRENKR